MFSFHPKKITKDTDTDDSITESKTIRFVEKCTVITDRRRKTLRVPRQIRLTYEDEDPELSEILSIGSLEVDKDQCQLDSLIAMVMTCIIDDAAESCCIMAKTFGLPDIQFDMSQKTLHERNELLRSHSTLFNPETLEDYSKTENIYMIRKLHSDIVFLQTILSKGVRSLLVEENYFPWLLFIDNYDLQLDQDAKLLEMVEKKTKKLHELEEQYQTDKLQFQIDCDQLSLAIGRARDEMEDFTIQSEIEVSYLENWEKSRRQQNLRIKTEGENDFQQKIAMSEWNTLKEEKVHMEIDSYMAEYFEDTENAIQDWMNTYDKDMEKKEEEILKMGFDIENLGNDLKALQENFDRRNKEMDDWLERKAEKARVEAEIKYINRMATKIQAWWRGTMVRRKLGPYRPASKKKKDKKKKKK